MCGTDRITGGSGVLEWCFDAADAKAVFKKMQQSYEFTHLDYRKWKTHTAEAKQPVVAPFKKGDLAYYRPSRIDMFSRHEGVQVKVVNVNKHGHISVELLGGPEKGSIRGIKPNQIDCLQKVS